MDLGIKGKWALVTGAGRGLGEGICRSLSQEGVRIGFCRKLFEYGPPDQLMLDAVF
tara:strand:+ start:414 stop:581 length:168 start_codon:yes stop_codon:yes gene_type:complete